MLLLVPSPEVDAEARPQQALGTLTARGEVYVNEMALTGEATVFAGNVVRTGADGAAGFASPQRGNLILAANSEVHIAATPRYFAELRRGTVGLRALADDRDFQVRIGAFVVVPSPGGAAAGEIERAADGSARVSCTLGSVGVIELDGAASVFLNAGDTLRITAAGQLSPIERPGAPPAAPPQPVPAAKKSRAGLILLGVGGGAAAAAALALSRGEKAAPVSPSRP